MAYALVQEFRNITESNCWNGIPSVAPRHLFLKLHLPPSAGRLAGIEFKDFILGFRQSTFLYMYHIKMYWKIQIWDPRKHGIPLNSQPG